MLGEASFYILFNYAVVRGVTGYQESVSLAVGI